MTDDHSIDRAALAHEVIVSAANVLRAAGFLKSEIGAFFRQAAVQLGDVAPTTSPQASPLASIARQFAESRPVLELQALAEDAGAVMPLGDDIASLRQAFDIAMRSAPLLAEAQGCLRDLATAAGLGLVATTAERGEDGTVVCLEDFAGAYAGIVDLLGALVDVLVAREDGEAFAYLLGHLAENGVIVIGPLQECLARGAELLDPQDR